MLCDETVPAAQFGRRAWSVKRRDIPVSRPVPEPRRIMQAFLRDCSKPRRSRRPFLCFRLPAARIHDWVAHRSFRPVTPDIRAWRHKARWSHANNEGGSGPLRQSDPLKKLLKLRNNAARPDDRLSVEHKAEISRCHRLVILRPNGLKRFK